MYDAGGACVVHGCGHVGPLAFAIRLWGEPFCSFRFEGRKPYCADCLLAEILRASRRCGSCGFAITPGDPVAFCVDHPAIGRRHWKTFINGDVLLCLRWDCDNVPGFCGHWTELGVRLAFPEGGNLISHVCQIGRPVVVQIGRLNEKS